jgi:CRP-like cAMP-binding protein
MSTESCAPSPVVLTAPGLTRRSLQIHQQRGERGNLERFVRSIQDGPPDGPELATILGLWRTTRHDPANAVLSAADGVRLITSGWAGWLRYANDGKRLIFLFLMPGDFIVPSLFEPGCCEVASLTPLRTVDASTLTGESSSLTPKSAAMIARSGRDYRLLLVDHLTRLTIGCTARSVAHLLNEFHERSVRAGWCENGRFSLPIGQRVLARSLGRSTVQINKIINQFQADGLIKVGYDWVDVLKPEALREAAGVTHSVRSPSLPNIYLEQAIGSRELR